MATLLERMKIRIGATSDGDELLQEMIDSAGEDVMAYTGRTSVPTVLAGVQLDLAVIRYNQRGIEGESSHSEGGVSRSISALPPDRQLLLNDQRLARTVY